MARGVVTDEVKAVSFKELGREVTQVELRLMVYVQNSWMDSAPVHRAHINREENNILSSWEADGWVNIASDVNGRCVYPTQKFYRAVSEILMVGYCSEWMAL